MRWLVIATLMFTGCSKADDGPSCDQVVDSMMAVTKQAMTGHGDMEVQNKKAMVDQCVARKMSADQRRCLVAAKDLAAIAACTPKK
ncbi:MAG: hypothetical protein IPQ07_29190 [Myxococcales bacterium]|nr:hypothetical protein [Myxococcales bacterium]